jgi:single-stranded-DNA-specific exonuclease
MADLDGLLSKYRDVTTEIIRLARSGKRILIVTHIDADGLCSGSIVFAALMRKGANVTIRALPDLDISGISDVAAQNYDFYVFTDLASTLTSELDSAMNGHFLVLDHHQLPEADFGNPSVVNAWQFGYDGGTEACSSSMAYQFAVSIDPANSDLSLLAVVGALADRQDAGPGRSLVGLNATAVEEARSEGLLSVTMDLTFTGRETRPVHEAIALTSTPYMKGLTGSKDSVLALLHQSGLTLREGGSWRTISSLSPDEKKLLTEIIAGALGGTAGATEALTELVGEAYTLQFEDPFTPLRDAREFGTLLNACGRMDAAGTGISVCLGDRTSAFADAMQTLAEYRTGINKALEGLTAEPSRIETHGNVVMVRGEGLVDEKLLGPVISILTSSPEFKDKMLVGTAESRGMDLKISSRVGDEFRGSVNLGLVMREAAEAVDGTGGGHAMAAGAKIPSSKSESFTKAILERVAA